MQDLAETYRQTSNDDLIRLHADLGSLTPEAREALSAEINRRGLTTSQVADREEQWKQEAADEQKAEQEKRKGRPIRWGKAFAQLGVILAVGIVYVMLMEGAVSLGLIRLTAEGQGVFGAVVGRLTIIAIIIAISLLRGRILATAVMTAILYVVVTVWVFVLH